MNGKYQRYILQNRKKIGISVVIFIFLIALGIAVVPTKSHSAFTTPSNKTVYVAINGSEDFNCDGSDDQVEINQVPLQKIWLFYKTSEKHHISDIYIP